MYFKQIFKHVLNEKKIELTDVIDELHEMKMFFKIEKNDYIVIKSATAKEGNNKSILINGLPIHSLGQLNWYKKTPYGIMYITKNGFNIFYRETEHEKYPDDPYRPLHSLVIISKNKIKEMEWTRN